MILKKDHTFLFFILLIVFASCTVSGQKQPAHVHAETIAKINELILENYVFPDVAERTAEHLTGLLNSGAMDGISDQNELADFLTAEVQRINHDKHMRIRVRRDPGTNRFSPHQFQGKFGFLDSYLTEDGIGYFDLRGFASVESAGYVADSIMNSLANAKFLIIDLRKNGGGSPFMVQYLCSYFFNEKIHLNSLYWRAGNRTEEFWTLDDVNGTKRPEIPLYILTSSYTFSGAEEFCYNMKTRERAILIGETTGGGANPGGVIPVNDSLEIFIPMGRAINPVTNTNWEGTGVRPDIEIPADQAMEKALSLIRSQN